MDRKTSRLSSAFRASVLAASLALGGAAPQPALAAAPQVKTQAPGYYRVMVGDFEVTVLSDGTIKLPVDQLLKQPAAKTVAALKKSWLQAPLELSGNAYLINTGSKLVLIDTGAGVLFGPTLGKLVANLRAAGYQPEQVDDVLITHMHPDHVGGLVSNGALVFPNATVHADARDADFWLSQANLDKAPADTKGFFQGAQASLKPVMAAGKFKPLTAGEVVPGVTARASTGHTAGHTSYVVESRGQRLFVVGDLIHVPSVQLEDPSVAIAYDTDEKAAVASRAAVFGEIAKDGDLVGAAHLPFPGLGHLRAAGKAWQWVPSNYTTELP